METTIHFIAIRMATIKKKTKQNKTENDKVGENEENLEHLCMLARLQNGANTKQYKGS